MGLVHDSGTGKIKDKSKHMQLGNIKSKGYIFEGIVDGFKAERRQFATIKSQWLLEVHINARGDGIKVFEKSMKLFQRKFRFMKK